MKHQQGVLPLIPLLWQLVSFFDINIVMLTVIVLEFLHTAKLQVSGMHGSATFKILRCLQPQSTVISVFCHSDGYPAVCDIPVLIFHYALNSFDCHCAEQFVQYCYLSCISDNNEVWKSRI